MLAPVKALIIDSGAAIAGSYRYKLWRTWDYDLMPTAWVMLNPSTADATVDDPTIRRCMAFSRRWGAGGIIVVNLFALRATDPADLLRAARAGTDPIGPENDRHLLDVFPACDVVIAAWGAHAMAKDRAKAVLSLVPETMELSCLGTTKAGYPRHPLYVSADCPLIEMKTRSNLCAARSPRGCQCTLVVGHIGYHASGAIRWWCEPETVPETLERKARRG